MINVEWSPNILMSKIFEDFNVKNVENNISDNNSSENLENNFDEFNSTLTTPTILILSSLLKISGSYVESVNINFGPPGRYLIFVL